MDANAKQIMILKASKPRFVGYLCAFSIFLVIAFTAEIPRTFIYIALKCIVIPLLLMGIVTSLIAIFSRRFDAQLDADGIRYGTLSGSRYYRWSEIKAVYLVRDITGKRVCVELERKMASEDRGGIILKNLPDNYGKTAEELAHTISHWMLEYRHINNN